MLVLTDVQKVKLSVKPVTAAGNPAPIDGKPVWTVSDESLATFTVDEEGCCVEVVTTGKLGTFQVNVKADADMGEGVKEIGGVLDVEVKASEAVSLGLDVGVPESRV